MSLDGLSMSALARELNIKLAGGRIDKIFQINNHELLFWIRQPGENIRLLVSANPEAAKIHLTEEAPVNPPVPPVFCMLLRKYAEDGRIAGVHQQGRDRVLILDIDNRGEQGRIITRQLVVEIMGKNSNIIFIQDGMIMDAIRRVGLAQSRYRQILPGRSYVAPPNSSNRLDPLSVTEEQIVQSLETQSGPLIKALISLLDGVGTLSAREIAHRAELSPEIAAETLTPAQRNRLALAIIELAGLLTTIPLPTVAITETNSLLGIAAFPLTHLSQVNAKQFPSLSAAVEFAGNLKGKANQPQEKQVWGRMLSAEISKLLRKEAVLQTELTTAENADEYRQKADILMAYPHLVEADQSQVFLPNFYSPDQEELLIALDPSQTPIENANSYYHKYNKLKRAQISVAEQLLQTNREITYLESLQLALDYARSAEEYTEIRNELAAAGYLRLPAKKRPDKQTALVPLLYHLPDNYSVYIGKNNRQNDLLTMKQAKPDDIWLHTKDIPGSHVIIRTDGRTPSTDTILLAARLAAYYSKARHSANVPVDYTRRRYVKKTAGAKPGFVTYDHQNTVYVTPPQENELQLFEQ